MKPVERENPVSIAETIIQMQESRDHSLSFVEIARSVISAAERLRIRMHKPKYNIGDIVYFNSNILSVSPNLYRYIGSPLIVVNQPLDTQKFKTYTLRLLPGTTINNDDDCWENLHYHEDFFTKREPDA
jgi:hypothetical protein